MNKKRYKLTKKKRMVTILMMGIALGILISMLLMVIALGKDIPTWLGLTLTSFLIPLFFYTKLLDNLKLIKLRGNIKGR